MSKIRSRLVVKPKIIESICLINQSILWDTPVFRVQYDLKVLSIFDHAHPIIIKLTLVFLNLHKHAKNQLILSIHSFEIQISEFHDPKARPIFEQTRPKTSTNKHDWNPVKYLSVLHHNRTQKQLQYFCLIYCKNLANFLFWVFGNVWLLSSKVDNPICRSFDLDELQMNSIHNLFLRDIVKTLQTCYFEYFENAWSCHHHALTFSWSCLSPCRKPWCPKCWNQLVGNFDVICIQKVNIISNFFLEILQWHCKLAISGILEMLDLTHQKILVSICIKLRSLSACKKSTEQTCYFRYFEHACQHAPKIMYQFEKTFNVY